MNDSLSDELARLTVKSTNAVKLKVYLQSMLARGHRLPSLKNRQEINRKDLALRAGFDRQGLDEQRGAKDTLKLLRWAIENVGFDSDSVQEENARKQQNPDLITLQKIISRQDKTILGLREKIERSEMKNNALRYESGRLRQRLAQLEKANAYVVKGHKIELYS